MIQKLHYRLLTVLLLLPALIFANSMPVNTYKTSKERIIQKTYNVDNDATLKVNNRFGNIDIITWDKNTIEFDILIRVSGNDDEKVEDRLDRIDVDFSATNTLVSAITKIDKNKSNWWNWGKKMNLKIEINYVIKIPITNSINIDNDFGRVNIDTLKGVAKISCDHGNITTKELMADGNELNFDHTKDSYFEYIKSGKINADFSSYTVAKAKNLIINADHTSSHIEVAENVEYNCDFKSLVIDNVNNVTGNADHLTLRIGNVYKSASIKSDFGSIKIGKVASNAQNIEIDAEHAGITMGYDSAYNFTFDISLEHASLRNSDDFNFIKKRIESTDKYYSGSYGSNSTKNLVKINSEFGSVTFKKQ
ncbi:hypothetical protein BTO05_03435 [Winogradskyella sp. PC-19]|uniref:hypothetical protein n=1 Tax=unclassified Winogradskyella TaxID=2615021 RepID=UPI000B3CD561|nr:MULTISPECIES: hypothetical protein [unclassified Winogradskyella]ARV08735.1 hypothetical protein BTO05_03435 [Winogradskyella sp. PC-19]